MTPKELKKICRELQLYSTPELNDKMYLHYKGQREGRRKRGQRQHEMVNTSSRLVLCLRPQSAWCSPASLLPRASFKSMQTTDRHLVVAGRHDPACLTHIIVCPLLLFAISHRHTCPGFSKIENLEAFTGLKVIYLEGNGTTRRTVRASGGRIQQSGQVCALTLHLVCLSLSCRCVCEGFRKIEGLDQMKELRCLYLQENQISTIEGISSLTDLDTLNLNQNVLTSLDGLAPLAKLNSLLVQGNKLKSLASVAGVLAVPSIGVLDLSRNNIEEEGVLDILSQLPNLKVLYLKDNPCVGAIANYRKRVVSAIPTLTYLDDRPVFEEERRTADAWARGGKAAEQAERKKFEQEKAEKEERNFRAFDDMVRQARLERGLPADDAEIDEKTTDQKEADESDDEEDEKKSVTRDAPPLEDAPAEPTNVLPPARRTNTITFTHTPDANTSSAATTTTTTTTTPAASPATAAAAAAPLLSLVTPASAANAAAASTPVKRALIEIVDDDEPAAADDTPAAASSVPDRAVIEQLD